VTASVFLTDKDRVSDVFNSRRQFVPLETDRGEFQIINKGAVSRVKPLPRELSEQEPSDNIYYA
jgi:hypothetical protein